VNFSGLSDYHFILGSKSPRRKELLSQLGVEFEIRTSDEEEIIPSGIGASEVPEILASQKADFLKEDLKNNELLITADTLVILENRILGKPLDGDDAFKMLRSLSGKWHEVITGISLLTTEKALLFHETTQVHFTDISDEEITYYIDNYKPFDKAGAYGIQEWIGQTCVNEIKGCFFNVIGLPLPRLYRELKKF
jgi:septum formation protein